MVLTVLTSPECPHCGLPNGCERYLTDAVEKTVISMVTHKCHLFGLPIAQYRLQLNEAVGDAEIEHLEWSLQADDCLTREPYSDGSFSRWPRHQENCVVWRFARGVAGRERGVPAWMLRSLSVKRWEFHLAAERLIQFGLQKDDVDLWARLVVTSLSDRAYANFRNPRRRVGFRFESQVPESTWDRIPQPCPDHAPTRLDIEQSSHAPPTPPGSEVGVGTCELNELLKLLYPTFRPKRLAQWLRDELLGTYEQQRLDFMRGAIATFPAAAAILSQLKERQSRNPFSFCAHSTDKSTLQQEHSLKSERPIVLSDVAIRKRCNQLRPRNASAEPVIPPAVHRQVQQSSSRSSDDDLRMVLRDLVAAPSQWRPTRPNDAMLYGRDRFRSLDLLHRYLVQRAELSSDRRLFELSNELSAGLYGDNPPFTERDVKMWLRKVQRAVVKLLRSNGLSHCTIDWAALELRTRSELAPLFEDALSDMAVLQLLGENSR